MGIRNATPADQPAISALLTQLGYPGTAAYLSQNLEVMINNPLTHVLVYESEGKVAGFIAFDFLPQLVVKGDFARISCFSVDENVRGQGIGNALEERFTQMARERNCDRIEVHCHTRRVEAHRFYYRQGYHESPKYLMKSLAD